MTEQAWSADQLGLVEAVPIAGARLASLHLPIPGPAILEAQPDEGATLELTLADTTECAVRRLWDTARLDRLYAFHAVADRRLISDIQLEGWTAELHRRAIDAAPAPGAEPGFWSSQRSTTAARSPCSAGPCASPGGLPDAPPQLVTTGPNDSRRLFGRFAAMITP